MLNKLYCHMRKYYHAYSFIANGLIALSMAGLSLLGVMSSEFTAAMLLAWGIFFAVLFGVGKLLDQEIEDIDKVKDHCDENTCK